MGAARIAVGALGLLVAAHLLGRAARARQVASPGKNVMGRRSRGTAVEDSCEQVYLLRDEGTDDRAKAVEFVL